MDRSNFLKNTAVAGGGLLLFPSFKSNETSAVFSVDEITEFVGAAHNSFENTQKIVEAKPLILNCTSQLAKGDFETAIGGASHMGHRDIADLLVSKGARMDIFNYAFLGHSDFVKDQITRHPHLLNSYGPHGFTLLHHAKVGEHNQLADWLMEQGLTEDIFKDVFRR